MADALGAAALVILLENRSAIASVTADDVPVETGAAGADRGETVDMAERGLSEADAAAPAAPKVRQRGRKGRATEISQHKQWYEVAKAAGGGRLLPRCRHFLPGWLEG